jgi:signal transduction histidine kinase
MLDVALRMTKMGFAAIARVTETRWITCSSLDHVGFGLKPGDELPIESTLCNEIRDHRQPIVFDDASADDRYRDHHTPRIYGLRSYISMPIVRADGTFWGTLCAIDPNPAKVDNPQVIGTFKLFAELIAHHLDAGDRLRTTEASLERERELSELREQFIAVLGHDLRNPLAAIDAGTNRLLKEGWTERSPLVLNLMKASISRMTGLVDNIMDLARARLGGGISLDLAEADLVETLQVVADEIRSAHPDREIHLELDFPQPTVVDRLRVAQLFSNIVSNAVTHGLEDHPVHITGRHGPDGIEVSVRNSGSAIPEEDLERLFMPFKRGAASRGGQGLGLGLYIALEIAKAHGGTIGVSSDETGTCFTFKMPRGR